MTYLPKHFPLRNPALTLVLLAGLLIAALPAYGRGPDEIARFGRDIVVSADKEVSDVACFGCSVTVRGRVVGDVAVFGGSLEVEEGGSVSGDAAVFGGNLRLADQARVGGDVAVFGGSIDRAATASIGGEVGEFSVPFGGLGIWGLLLVCFLLALVSHLILVLLAWITAGETRISTVALAARTRAGMSLLAGVATVVAAVIMLTISSLLGPLAGLVAVLVCLGALATLVLGYAGLSLWIGGKAAPSRTPLAMLVLGALLITLLQFIPLLGLFLFLFFAVMALGAAVLSGWGNSSDWLAQQVSAGGTPPAPAG